MGLYLDKYNLPQMHYCPQALRIIIDSNPFIPADQPQDSNVYYTLCTPHRLNSNYIRQRQFLPFGRHALRQPPFFKRAVGALGKIRKRRERLRSASAVVLPEAITIKAVHATHCGEVDLHAAGISVTMGRVKQTQTRRERGWVLKAFLRPASHRL